MIRRNLFSAAKGKQTSKKSADSDQINFLELISRGKDATSTQANRGEQCKTLPLIVQDSFPDS